MPPRLANRIPGLGRWLRRGEAGATPANTTTRPNTLHAHPVARLMEFLASHRESDHCCRDAV